MGQCSAAAGRAVSGVVAAPIVLSAELANAFDQKPLKVGLLGLGQRGQQWAEAIACSDFTDLTSWYDPNMQAVQRANLRFQKRGLKPVETAISEQALIQNQQIDALVIASPSFKHTSQIEQALIAGKHILTEKPIGLELSQIAAASDILRKSNEQILMVASSRRRLKLRQAVLDWLRSEPLGRLIDIQINWSHPQGPPRGQNGWLADPAKTGDWLAEHGDHIWDLLAEIHPDMPDVLSASKIAEPRETSRFWKVELQLQNNATATIRHSMLPGSNFQSPGLSFFVQFEKGMVDLITGRVSYDRTSPLEVPQFPKESDEMTDTLRQFCYHIGHLKTPLEIAVANQSELDRALWIAQLRARIESTIKS